MTDRFLSPREVAAFYDRFGRKQDWQRIYEGPAIRALEDAADFADALAILEVGCGTGAFAENILRTRLSSRAVYTGIDISQTMIALSRAKLSPFGARARLVQADATQGLPYDAASFDRVVANYVLDLLPDDVIASMLDDAHRLLRPGGLLCTLNLTFGQTFPARLLTRAWSACHRYRPALVGGCRPLVLAPLVDQKRWDTRGRDTVRAFGITSELLVLTRRPD